jgi:hypothetical protein
MGILNAIWIDVSVGTEDAPSPGVIVKSSGFKFELSPGESSLQEAISKIMIATPPIISAAFFMSLSCAYSVFSEYI